MITAFMAADVLHAVHVIHQDGLTKIRAHGLCTVEGNAGPGVYQVPDWAFDGRPAYGKIPVCAKCAGVVIAMKALPK
jgi:hypothetical protein